ncbi:hypothetical protein ISS08_01160 [Candidatus Pacearchaeota archaeon]|nr:hypothetical protein [Candidatus Pacearchaeota archaeon]
MEQNKKGLSMIVSTLIIILLVLVAVGIIWVVARNLIQDGSEQIDISAKCLEVSLSASAVNCVINNATAETCAVTLERAAGGEAIGGAKMVFQSADGLNNFIATYTGDITPLGKVTEADIVVDGFNDSNKVEITPFFLDDSGNENLCSLSTAYNF